MYNHLKPNLDLTHQFQDVAGFKISRAKTWMSSTSSAARSVMREGKGPDVCMSKVEPGMLFRFTRSQSFSPVQPRWEQGLDRISRLVCTSWPTVCKVSVVNQGVFAMIFSGCETLHISLSNFRTIGARLHVAVMGRGSLSSHLLSPLFASSDVYEPLLYVLKSRLDPLRSCIVSFGDKKALDSWNQLIPMHLPSKQHQILGPMGLFICSCQILKWEVLPDLQVQVSDAVVLKSGIPLGTRLGRSMLSTAFNHFLTKPGHPFTSISFI